MTPRQMGLSEIQSIVVIGAGQAGGWAAKTLRDQKFAGKIFLVGDEHHPPYERPPLSKDVLLGSRSPESTYLWSRTKLVQLGMDLMLGCRAIAVNRENKTVILSNGQTLAYDRLMLTVGSRVRQLGTPGAALPGIHYMRGINDALAIRQSLVPGSRLIVVGGGWIGLEIAAAARQRNVDVILVEASGQLCSRVLPPPLANYLQRRHEERGVRIFLGTTVVRFGHGQHFKYAELSDGTQIPADTAVIGIGVIPNAEIATEAGLESENGIVVDTFGRTSDHSIYAAGDVANQPDGLGGRVRLESWANAQNQAIAVAKAMLGGDSPYRDVPYFWSDQYETKLQILGIFANHDDVVVRGNDDSRFMSFYMNGDKIIAVAGIDCPQEIAAARRIMQRGMAVDRRRLASAENLNEILRGAPSAVGC
ncbi:MAG TPA: FAD-dependent oxidoreductase [Candidatus Binataceae bacterium]|nr:FAD-dependent oxidoreductase [Candidatus Binataceae bacterium]